MHEHSVWITGIGACTPLGSSYEEIADNLLAGRSGIRTIEHFDTADFNCRIAGLMPAIPCPSTDTPEAFSAMTRFEQLVHWCTVQALQSAGLWDRRHELRIGLVGGMGAEWLQIWEDDYNLGGGIVFDPASVPPCQMQRVSDRLGLRGPVLTVGAACASGNIALGQAKRWLKEGWVDVCLAGGFDLPVTPHGLASFCNLGAVTKRNDAPTAASRPFDKGRDGFVLGEGGTFFVLEKASSARKRNARAWAEVAGFGASSDAFHLVIPATDPGPASRAIQSALRDAGANASDIDAVNAHATSTPVGDRFETNALRTVLGDRLPKVPVSGTKSMSGHLLSAAAAFETIGCIVALERGVLPPTINLDDPDPECDLCHVRNESREHPTRLVLNNSFGFGGSNTCVVLRKVA